MKTLRITKNLESNLRKKYLNNINTDADLVSLVGVQYDRVVVDVDSSKNDSKTVYEHDGTSWVFIAKVSDVEHELIFTEDRNVYITDKDRKLMKMGDVLPFEDIDDIVAKDPAILNKLFITKKGKIYFYNSDGAYKLVSGGGGAGGTNRLADVATYAEIITTYPKPDDWDCVVVLNDEGHDGQKTWYVFDGAVWAYQGIYFNETLVQEISDRGVRSDIINADTDYELPFEYIVGRKHLEIHVEDELLIQGIDYVEDTLTDGYVSNKIQFKYAIPKEARIIFKRKVATSEGDSRITRITGELWLKFLDTVYADFDTKLKNTGLSVVTNNVPNVTNITDNAVTTFKVPKDKPIGYRVLVRKAHAGTNLVTITAEDATEKFTYALLTSLTLTSDGDYWELEKVTDTRWELTAGIEKSGTLMRTADGMQTFTAVLEFPAVPASTFRTASVTIPKPFVNNSYGVVSSIKTNVPGSNQSEVGRFLNNGCWVNAKTPVLFGYETYAYVSTVSLPVQVEVIMNGRWY